MYYEQLLSRPLALLLTLWVTVLASQVFAQEDPRFEAVHLALDSLTYSAVDWGDYDGDGNLDFILTGVTGTVENPGHPVTAIYRNTGAPDYTFEHDANLSEQLPRIFGGTVLWGDYDADGDLDLFMAGSIEGNTEIAAIYTNLGDGAFVNLDADLTGVSNSFLRHGGGSAAWGDYDLDGDLDLAYTGLSTQANGERLPKTLVYRNQNGIFQVQEYDLDNHYNASVVWDDYDNDGDLDLLISGLSDAFDTGNVRAHSDIMRHLTYEYQNLLIDSSNPRPAGSNALFSGGYVHAWEDSGNSLVVGDYDNDGDSDYITAGNSHITLHTQRTQGLNTFSEHRFVARGPILGSAQSALVDYDGDGLLDFVTMGFVRNELTTLFYRNTAARIPEHDATIALPGFEMGDMAWGDYDHDGDLDLIISGRQINGAYRGGRTMLYRNTTNDVSFFTPFEQFATTCQGDVLWGDHDSDGDMDMLLTGSDRCQGGTPHVLLYENATPRPGGFGFPEPAFEEIALPLVFTGSTARADWKDYDNDNDLDILLNTQVYRNDGRHRYTLVFDASTADFVRDADFRIAANEAVGAWGDYDSDGALDLILVGQTPNNRNTRRSMLFRNTGDGFAPVAAALDNIPAVTNGSVSWGDVNADGFADLLVAGGRRGANADPSEVFLNTLGQQPRAADTPIFVPTADLPPNDLFFGRTTWADVNADGYLDAIYTGNGVTGIAIQVYNPVAGMFTPLAIRPDPITGETRIGTAGGGISVADLDIDGDLDVLVVGSGNAAVFLNEGAAFEYSTVASAALIGRNTSDVAVADYDNDGDMDAVIIGNGRTMLYRNNASALFNRRNRRPQTPTRLQFVADEPDVVTLRWQATSDLETPTSGLSYNLFLGTGARTHDILNPMSAYSFQDDLTFHNGIRKIVTPGNAGGQTEMTVRDLAPGRYCWGVQAIDNSFAGSPFTLGECFELFAPGEEPVPVEVEPAAIAATSTEPLPNTRAPFVRQTVRLTNPHATALEWKLGWEASWLSVEPRRGALEPRASVTLNLTLRTDGLPQGTYQDSIDVVTSLPRFAETQIPMTFKVTTPIDLRASLGHKGGVLQINKKNPSLSFKPTVQNASRHSQTVDIWAEITYPDGTIQRIEPHLATDMALRSGETIHGLVEQLIPEDVPVGIYQYALLVGDAAHTIVAWDAVTFEKADAQAHGKTGSATPQTWDVLNGDGFLFAPHADWERTTDTAMPSDAQHDAAFQGLYPNPFNPTTALSYTLPQAAPVRLTVYDALGRQVAVLVDTAHQAAGQHQVTFEASHLASGMYLYRFESAEVVQTGRMLLMK